MTSVMTFFLTHAGGRKYGIVIVIVVVGYGYVWWKVMIFYIVFAEFMK